MFSSLSITWNAVAKSLAKINSVENRGDYVVTLTEGDLVAKVYHTYGAKRLRRNVRFELSALSADPLLTGQYVPVSMTAQVFIDVPKGNAIPVATQKYALTALADWLKAGTNADQFLAGEN